ncbi:MAG: HD domain-containing protein [Bacteroidales bacterium]|nr:HD domain-containing protein [Bacteroidales bacterium]
MKDMRPFISGKLFEVISAVSIKRSEPAYVIGGYVRDLLLERPSKDIDIVVVGNGIEFASAVAEKLNNTKDAKFYGQFGTAMIKHKDMVIEFVGARKESYQHLSRKPEVSTGSLSDDQKRRDFTINALAISLNAEDFGQLLDPFGGITDLQKKIICTPLDPDITYSDDPLRMMRAIRFATQLGFSIHPDSYIAIARNKNRIKIISMERISDELNKIILSEKPSIGFKLLFDSGILQIVFPQFVALQGVEKVNNQSHKDNFYHTLEVLDNLSKTTNDLWLRWAAVLHDIAKPATKKYEPLQGWTFHGHEFKGAKMVPGIFKQLKLPLNEPMRFVQKLVLLHLRPIVLAQEIVTDSAVRRLLFDAGDDIDALMLLCEADITSKNEYKVKKYRDNFELVRQKLKEIEAKDKVRNWQPPISGEIIMQVFGLRPGREVGHIKTAIRDAILDGLIKNEFEEAYLFMKEEGKRLHLRVVEEADSQPVKANGPLPL